MDNFISKTETNNAKGIQHTLDYLSQFNVALITLEATGGLEIPVAKALARAGYRVFIANPLKASEFAKSQTRAKTDAKMRLISLSMGSLVSLKAK